MNLFSLLRVAAITCLLVSGLRADYETQVTGSTSGGSVWGSGPYTDDSDLNKAAVHAGLISPGQTATIRVITLGSQSSFPGSTANGVTTSDWFSSWGAVNLELVSVSGGGGGNTPASVSHSAPSTVYVGASFTVYASCSDPDGNLSGMSVRWQGLGLQAYWPLSGSSASQSVTLTAPSTPGTFNIRAEALDTLGEGSDSGWQTITVIDYPPANSPPDVYLSLPASVEAGASFTVTAHASDPDGNLSTLGIRWQGQGLVGNPSWVDVSGASASRSVTVTAPAAAGTLYFRGEVFDAAGAGVAADWQAVVVVAPAPATLVATPVSVTQGGTLTVGYSGAPDSTTWIGLYSLGETNPLSYYRASFVPNAGAGTVSFAINGDFQTTLTYEARLFPSNGTNSTAISNTFAVAAAAPTYTLTVQNGTGGASGLAPGTVRTIVADQAPAGYAFWHWTLVGPGTGTVGNVNSPTTILTMANSDVTVRAEFTGPPVTLTVEGGTANPATPSPAGTVVTITAGPPPGGQAFSGWTVLSGPGVLGSTTQSPTTFALGVGNATVRANYSPTATTYTLTVDGGTANPATPNPAGTVVTITAAQPPAGQSFAGWTLVDGPGTLGSTGQTPTTFTLGSGNATVRADYSSVSPSYTIASNVNNFNLAAALGQPATAQAYTVTINSGVIVGSGSTTSPAFTTGSLPAGSTVTLINHGRIQGAGGRGGDGGTGSNNGGQGQAGGDAFSLTVPVTIDNTQGEIWGGGGGGGGSGAYWNNDGTTSGSGGGGGAGSAGGAGGGINTSVTYPFTGEVGSPGTSTNGGSGGFTSSWGHQGGQGGAPGQPGSAGSAGCNWYFHDGIGSNTGGGPGGDSGAAVRANGYSVTWLGGGSTPSVKGAGGGSSSPPAAPAGVAATGNLPDRIAIAWVAVTGATGYDVSRSMANNPAGAAKVNAGPVAVASYDDATAGVGTIYYYWVKAKGAGGDSVFSSAATGLRALPAPGGVSATDTLTDRIALSWDAVSGATGYDVYRHADNSSAAATKLNAGALTATAYDDLAAVTGTTYYYWVKAKGGDGDSAFSGSDTGLRLPAAPANLRQTEIGASFVALAWDPPAGGPAVDYYELGNGSGNYAAVEGTETAMYWGGLTPGTTYAFQVRAVDAAGNRSAWTALPAITTAAGGTPSGATRWLNLSRNDIVNGQAVYTAPDGILDEVIGVDGNRFSAAVSSSSWSYSFNNFWTLWGITWPDGSFTPNFTYALLMEPFWDEGMPVNTAIDVDVSFEADPGHEYAVLRDDSASHVFDLENTGIVAYPVSFPLGGLHHIYTGLAPSELQFAKFYLVRYGAPLGSVAVGGSSVTLGTTRGSGGLLSIPFPATGNVILSIKDAVGQALKAGSSIAYEVWDGINQIRVGTSTVGELLDIGVTPAGDFQIGLKLDDATMLWFNLTVQAPPSPQIAVDANRDGTITFDPSDATTSAAPYRFWLNDDNDREVDTRNQPGGEVEQDDVDNTSSGAKDSDDVAIPCERDLEDQARLWINANGFADVIRQGDRVFGLRWLDTTGSPAIRLHRAVESNGGMGYLTTPSIAVTQVNEQDGVIGTGRVIGVQNINNQANGTVIDTSGCFSLGSTLFNNVSASAPTTYFLFEGVSAGTGRLQLVVLKPNPASPYYVIEQEGPSVWMDLRPAHQFVERWSCGDDSLGPVLSVVRVNSKSGPSVPPASDADKDYVMYVHGYNMKEYEKQRWLETTYKRLWHTGYKGRVGAFTWPCSDSPTPFDQSEHRAWQAAAQLQSLLSSLKIAGFRVHLLGHSQGNVVISEALRQAGANSAIASSYIASQAALAAHCFDPSQPDRSGPVAFTPTTPNVYARYWMQGQDANLPANWPANSPAYFDAQFISGSVGKFINFFNTQDYALTGNGLSLSMDGGGTNFGWLTDQRLKPNIGYGYNSIDGFYFGSDNPETGATRTRFAFPNDRFDVFSYGAQARSITLGASPDMGGVFTDAGINLTDAQFGFLSHHVYHSGQFRSFAAARTNYWVRLLVELGLRAPQ